MKRKLTGIMLMSALLVGGASTFVSCKDYDGDQAAVQIANLQWLRDKVTANEKALFGDPAIEGDKGIIGDLESLGLTSTSGSGFTQEFKDDLKNLHATTLDAQEALKIAKAAQSTADEAKKWIVANKELELLKGKCEALAAIAGCKDVILQLDKMTETWGKDLSNVVVRSELASYLKTEDLDKKLEELGYEKVADMKDDVRSIINDWTAEIAGDEGAIKDYPSLVKAFNQLPAQLEKINKTFEDIYKKLGIVNQMVASLVTGINIDMVENPFWGTLNTPFGLKSTVLVGYVGGQISSEKVAVFGGEDEEGGLAQTATGGSIYLTINPNDIEAEGMTFALVGRDGVEAPGYQIMPLVKDNSQVTTLTTRAAAVNGYKADFALKDGDGKAAMIDVDKEALKDVASNVLGKLKGEESLDLAKAAQTIFSTFANAVDQYYALQAAWNEVQLDGTVKERAVVSDYNIAAVTVKPLGYESLNAVDNKLEDYNIPQIPLLQDWMNANITKITYSPIDVNSIKDVTVEIDNAKNVKVEYNGEGSDGSGKVTFTPSTETGHEGEVTIDFSNINVKGETLEVTVKLDDLRKVVADLNEQVSDMVGNVNGLFDKATDLATSADRYISKVNSVLSAANKFIHNLPNYIQPVLVAVGTNGPVRLSGVDGIYTQFTGGDGWLDLVPTSYTAELLAPAYKKSIKVDNGQELIDNCDGTVKSLSVELTKGKHTITYRAMDYFGTIVTKKYYVEVK